jgi:hypothetical protein
MLLAAVVRAPVASAAGTMVISYQIWDQFRHDKGPQPASTTPVVAE